MSMRLISVNVGQPRQVVPFGNFIFHRNAGRPDGFPNNPYLVKKFQDLLVGGGRQLFNVEMRDRS